MNAAPCSCRVSTKRMLEFSSESMKWAFSSPGTPKMYSMPSSSRHRTNRSEALTVISCLDVGDAHTGWCMIGFGMSRWLSFLVDVNTEALNDVEVTRIVTDTVEYRIPQYLPDQLGSLLECALEPREGLVRLPERRVARGNVVSRDVTAP